MKRKAKIIVPIVAIAMVAGVLTWYLRRYNIDVLEPRGPVAHKERGLIIFAMILAAIVVIPTFTLTIYISWKYREENHTEHTKYSPDFDHSRLFEGIWWGIPIVIIGILSVVAWNSAHSLDPYKPLASDKQQLTVQVVALDWKWLFIYPGAHVASVNLAEVPVGTPVDFQVTSDAVMNSFWVPSLGGQIYAMPGMITQVHLLASQAGSYFGSPANIAGKGFARMDFTVRAASKSDYDAWLKHAAAASRPLTVAAYEQLAKPSDSVPVSYYSAVPGGLYNAIPMQYMMPDMSLQQQLGSGAVSVPTESKPTVAPATDTSSATPPKTLPTTSTANSTPSMSGAKL